MTTPVSNRTINTVRNVFYGILMKGYQIVMPFIMRTAMIYFLGAEYLGLNGLFVSVLQILSLAELGVGSAMVYSMYAPIAENDRTIVCALLALYRNLYRIIGTVVLVAGLIAIPALPLLIRGDIPPDLNLVTLYIFYLGSTVMTYWLFAYKTSLLQAMQRFDIVSKVNIAVNTVMYVIQIAMLLLGSYYGYVAAYAASLVVINLVNAACATKRYPDLKPSGSLSSKAKKEIAWRIRDLFTAKLGGVLLNAAPTIVVSAFLGLTFLAIYQNYYFIAQSVSGLIGVMLTACLASIGNSIVTETREKNYEILRVLTLAMSWVIGFCACCILCLTQPFMEVWVGKGYMLDFSAAAMIALYFLVFNMTVLLTTFKDAAGIWHQDRFRPLATSLLSLIACLILIKPFGVYGVFAATPLAQLIVALPWVLHNLFSNLFVRSMLNSYLIEFLRLSFASMLLSVLLYLICSFVSMDPITTLLIRVIICTIVFNMLYFASVLNMPEFARLLLAIDRAASGKLAFIARMARYASDRHEARSGHAE